MNKKQKLRLDKLENYLQINKVELKDSLTLADGINVCGLTTLIDISDNFTQVSELNENFEETEVDLIKQYAGDDVIHNSVLESLEKIDSYVIQDTFDSLLKEVLNLDDFDLYENEIADQIFKLKITDLNGRHYSKISDFDENTVGIRSTFYGDYSFDDLEFISWKEFKEDYELETKEIFKILQQIKSSIKKDKKNNE